MNRTKRGYDPVFRRLALALWIVWAVVVWNVVFDHVIVVAGREFIVSAGLAARNGGAYARMDDWMRPAVTRGLWLASAAAGIILVFGIAGWKASGRRQA